MKFKNLIVCTSLLFAAQLAFSVETGGLVTNDTTFANVEKDGALKLNQKNGANIWLRLPITADGSSYFTAEGAFKSEYIASEEDSDKKLKLTLDATLFKLTLKKELSSGDLQLSAGRFFNADTTGLIYSQNGDGLKIDANISKVSLSLYGAYTGLLNAKNVTILNQGNNSELSPDLTDKEKTLYVVAKKYAVGAATFSSRIFSPVRQFLSKVSEHSRLNQQNTAECTAQLLSQVQSFLLCSTVSLQQSACSNMMTATPKKATSPRPHSRLIQISSQCQFR